MALLGSFGPLWVHGFSLPGFRPNGRELLLLARLFSPSSQGMAKTLPQEADVGHARVATSASWQQIVGDS